MLSGNIPNNSFDMNYFIQKAKVKSVDVKYRELVNNKLVDITLTVVFDVFKKDNTTFEKTVKIFGNYDRDETNMTVKGWGSAFKIKMFFNACNLTNWHTDDMGVLPKSLLDSAIGKEVYMLSYRTDEFNNDKRVYYTYKIFGRTSSEVEERFLKDIQSDYPPYNYSPNNEDTSFNYEYQNEDVI